MVELVTEYGATPTKVKLDKDRLKDVLGVIARRSSKSYLAIKPPVASKQYSLELQTIRQAVAFLYYVCSSVRAIVKTSYSMQTSFQEKGSVFRQVAGIDDFWVAQHCTDSIEPLLMHVEVRHVSPNRYRNHVPHPSPLFRKS